MLPRPIYDEPNLVTDNAYLNFLRYFKRMHRSYGMRRLLQAARCAWDQLTEREQRRFERQRLLKTLRKYFGKQACLQPKRAIRKRPGFSIYRNRICRWRAVRGMRPTRKKTRRRRVKKRSAWPKRK